MEKPFAKRIRYSSHLYRNIDRLLKAEQDDELLPCGSANVTLQLPNVHDGCTYELDDNHLTQNAGENDNTLTTEYGDGADDNDDPDESIDHVVDYLIESSDEELEDELSTKEYSVQDALHRWAISKK
ncbi:uncharacterized protein LOC118515132 [Anopheles stephensi]|uniref:uncharacterized protein LOC118515132 n=1 Tax=Anopheles stephensi TaxID=30069 RepID=UPI001658B72D|nr:uncharacterized protein LOC118515132 [Anopheles stephensi]